MTKRAGVEAQLPFGYCCLTLKPVGTSSSRKCVLEAFLSPFYYYNVSFTPSSTVIRNECIPLQEALFPFPCWGENHQSSVPFSPL
jgi:hypothetical protein